MTRHSVFNEVVAITYEYLGPAATRFVSRQVSGHLHKKPESLSHDDLPSLIDWIKVAMGFLTDDRDLIDEYISRLQTLQDDHEPEDSYARQS